MPLALTTPPATEPITLTEAKTFLRIDTTEEDTLIQSLILAARVHTEQLINKKLITQTWSLFLNNWPNTNELQLPLNPVLSINEIKTYDTSGSPTTWPSENYTTDILSTPARIIKRTNWPTPEQSTNGIEISITAGYGDTVTDTPEPIRQAIRHLITHWYENREPVSLGENTLQIPDTVQSLLTPYKTVRL